MHFYNTTATQCPPPPLSITLCPELSLLSQRLPSAQGAAVNQVSLELSRTGASVACATCGRSIWAECPFPPPALVWTFELCLNHARFQHCGFCLMPQLVFTTHSLAKESLIRGHLCGGGVKSIHHPAAALGISGSWQRLTGSAGMATSLQCANGIWACENQAIFHFFPLKMEVVCDTHSRCWVCGGCSYLRPSSCHSRTMAALAVASHLAWRPTCPGSTESPAQLGRFRLLPSAAAKHFQWCV